MASIAPVTAPRAWRAPGAQSGQAASSSQLLRRTKSAKSAHGAALTGGLAGAAGACVACGSKGSSRRNLRRGTLQVRAVATLPPETKTQSTQSWKRYDLKWGVHKFGGASLNDAKLYKICGDLLLSESKGTDSSKTTPTAAIVSAAGGMTDALVSIIDTALTSVDESLAKLKAASDRQKAILMELVPDRPELTDPVLKNIDQDQDAVKAMLLAGSKMRGVPPQMLEFVAGLGEVWSAQTLSAYLKTTGKLSEWIDARDVLIVPEGPLSGLGEKGTAMDTIEPFWDETKERLERWWGNHLGDSEESPFLIITGFVCSTLAGRPTTLKRSGSDYSATIFAKILDASNVTFWKNVSGVYTADPRQVPEAFPVNSMTFDEAMELAYFGGQVLHPSAMVPCIEERIPVLVKNVFDPAHPGTRVYGRGDAYLRWEDQDDEVDENMPVKAITSIEKVSLLTIAGASFLGTHGVAERLMASLAKVGVNVILTSQGSSEHSISVAVSNTDGQLALNAVEDAFQLEIARNTETRAALREDLSILAVIGEGMKNYAGISGRFFNALGQSKVNIVAIAQGSSERNISAVVSRDELPLALKATHDAFLLKETSVSVSLLGSGKVGSAFLQKLAAWEANQGRNSTLPSMREVEYLSIDLRALSDVSQMLVAPRGLPLAELEKHIDGATLDLGRIAASWEKDLLQTGDQIDSLTGVLSGTLSLVFNQLNAHPEMPFSEAYQNARERDLPNPNPIEDLSGQDTAQKSLILARELGLRAELKDVEIEPLLETSGDDIIQQLKDNVDGPMAERFRKAREDGELLYYVGRVDVQQGKVSVGIHSFPAKQPPFALQDADYAVQVVSQRFPKTTPLVFRGPGAGAEFTASGLLASLLRVCRSLA